MATMLVAAGAPLSVVSPASASGGNIDHGSGATGAVNPDFGYSWTDTKCNYHLVGASNVDGCVEIGWKKQDDGTGILITDLWVSLTNGCNDNNFYSPRVESAQENVENMKTGNIVSSSPIENYVDCVIHRDRNLPGPDQGGAVVGWYGYWNTKSGFIYDSETFTLCPDGTHDAGATCGPS